MKTRDILLIAFAAVIILTAGFFLGYYIDGPADPVMTPTPTLVEPSPEPTPSVYEPLPWEINACSNPELTTLEKGFVWAKFDKGDGEITQLRRAHFKNNSTGEVFTNPLMEAPTVSSGLRVPIQDGVSLLIYRKPLQGNGAVYFEVCDPNGYYIEFKWMKPLGPSTTGD